MRRQRCAGRVANVPGSSLFLIPAILGPDLGLVGRTGPSQVQGPRDVIVANSSTTLWGVHEMARPEGAKSETRRAESRGVLGEDMLPSLPDRDSGEGCKLPSRVRGESQAIWRFRIFMGSQISRFWCQFC